MKNAEEFQKIGQQNLDATVRGFSEFNKGMQAIGMAITDYARRSLEQNTRVAERMTAARSFEQIMEIQSEHARATYDEYMAEASRIGNMYAEMARDAYRPFERILHGS